MPVVVSELEFFNVEREVLGADLLERAHAPALNEGQEPLNRIGMDRAHCVFPLGPVNRRVEKSLSSPR